MSAGHTFKQQEQLSLATRDVGGRREAGQGQRTCWHQLEQPGPRPGGSGKLVREVAGLDCFRELTRLREVSQRGRGGAGAPQEAGAVAQGR